jgi:SAM-dependent methyltransferase
VIALDPRHLRTAAALRGAIERKQHDVRAFRAALLDVPARERDAWVDRVLGLADAPEDGPSLPAGGVPYFPCSVDFLLRVVDEAPVRASDVFVDIGAGTGRAMALVHLLTGASSVGVEVQPEFVRAARALTARLGLDRVACWEGDAAAFGDILAGGSVFFLNCPFSGARLNKVLDAIERVALSRPVSLCCVLLPLPPRPWLVRDPAHDGELEIYRGTSARPHDDACAVASDVRP